MVRWKGNCGMRTIKFRVWDKKSNRFCVGDLKNEPMGLSLDGRGLHWWDLDFGWLGDDITRFVVQQFTGWLDSQFREIYEGDLVSFYTPGNFDSPEKLYHENMLVRFDEEYGCYEFVNGRGMGELAMNAYSDAIDTESFVITGNIFENPKLLT